MPGGYTGIKNVYSETPQQDDVQQSFFIAETLKVNIFKLFQFYTLHLPCFQTTFLKSFHAVFTRWVIMKQTVKVRAPVTGRAPNRRFVK